MKLIEKAKVELTVKRENGNIEKVVTDKFGEINDVVFNKIKKQTSDAGRGEVIEYKNIPAVWEDEEADNYTICERCGEKIKIDKAYSQKEETYFNGKKVEVTAYYCKDCAQLLKMVGFGEQSELENRKSNAINEPEGKTDY